MPMVMAMRDVVATKGELPSLGEKPMSKGKKIFGIVFRVFLLALFTVIIAASAQITYDYLRYQKFFVNGESMYPTLNRDTKHYDTNGSLITSGPTYTIGDFSTPGTYVCDYGISDSSASFRNSLARYSVVVTYFDDDMAYNAATGTYAPHIGSNGAIDRDLKIKRIIGLPGETLYFDASGDLYVKKAGETDFAKIDQPFFDEEDDWTDEMKTWVGKAKPASANSKYGSEASPCILTEEEYFVCGDNRLASTDSRAEGPIHSYSLQGKAVAVTAKCSYVIPTSGSGSASWKPLWNSFLMPWELRYLSDDESA